MLQPILRIAMVGSARAFSTASSATLCLAGIFHQEIWGRLPTGVPEDVTQQRLGPLADEHQPPFRRMRMRKRKRIEFESLGDAQAFLGEERKKLQKLIDQKHDQKHSECQQKTAEELHLNSSQPILKIKSPPLPAPSALPNSAPDQPAMSALDQAIDSSLLQVDHPQPEKISPVVKELGKLSNTKPFDEVAIEHISQRYASNICELRHICRHREIAEQFHKAYQKYTLKKKAFRGFRVKKEKLQKRARTIHEEFSQCNLERVKKARSAEVERMWDLVYDRKFTLEKINYLDLLKIRTSQDKHPVFQRWKHLKTSVRKTYEHKGRLDFEVSPTLFIGQDS